jgi:hypothetical protein
MNKCSSSLKSSFGAAFVCAMVSGCLSNAELLPQSSESAPALVASPPHPNSINGQLGRPWYHIAGPVSQAKWQQDQAKCKLTASMAPTNGGTPEIKFLVTFIICLKAEGYQPQDSGRHDYKQNLALEPPSGT